MTQTQLRGDERRQLFRCLYVPYAYKELGIGKLIGMPVAAPEQPFWWETPESTTHRFRYSNGSPVMAPGKTILLKITSSKRRYPRT